MTVQLEPASRIPMSWEDYLALDPDDVRGEYLGGHLIVMDAPSQDHQTIAFELAKLLEPVVPTTSKVSMGVGWSPRGSREELIPDVMVHPRTRDQKLHDVPDLVVEIASSTPRRDYVEKTTRYATWGSASYWILDPRQHLITTFELRDGVYSTTAQESEGRVRLRFGAVELEVDLDVLFAVD